MEPQGNDKYKYNFNKPIIFAKTGLYDDVILYPNLIALRIDEANSVFQIQRDPTFTGLIIENLVSSGTYTNFEIGVLDMISSLGLGASELEKVTENTQTGWRLLGVDPLNYGDIGINAVDFSQQSIASSSTGATGENSFATGSDTIAVGKFSHVEGLGSIAEGDISHAEGEGTYAQGLSSHAENEKTIALGQAAHAEGISSQANGTGSHAEGMNTIANGVGSHSEGTETIADGDYSHAGGVVNTTNTFGETVVGCYAENIAGNPTTFDAGDPAFRVGIGPFSGFRLDGFKLLKSGEVYISQYPNSRTDGGMVNLLGTDGIGKVISNPVTDIAGLMNEYNPYNGTPLTMADLVSFWPVAPTWYKIYMPNLVGGGLVYTKIDASGIWVQEAIAFAP